MIASRVVAIHCCFILPPTALELEQKKQLISAKKYIGLKSLFNSSVIFDTTWHHVFDSKRSPDLQLIIALSACFALSFQTWGSRHS